MKLYELYLEPNDQTIITEGVVADKVNELVTLVTRIHKNKSDYQLRYLYIQELRLLITEIKQLSNDKLRRFFITIIQKYDLYDSDVERNDKHTVTGLNPEDSDEETLNNYLKKYIIILLFKFVLFIVKNIKHNIVETLIFILISPILALIYKLVMNASDVTTMIKAIRRIGTDLLRFAKYV